MITVIIFWLFRSHHGSCMYGRSWLPACAAAAMTVPGTFSRATYNPDGC
jgi:hypothetical protein